MDKSTKGEEIVRVNFNATGDTAVDQIKSRMAEMINFIDQYKELDPRLAAIATTKIEEAAMFAVKLVTTNK